MLRTLIRKLLGPSYKVDTDTRVVGKSIAVLLFILVVLLVVSSYFKIDDPPPESHFGHQFESSDVQESPTGKIMMLASACDLSGDIVPVLFDEGFEIYSFGTGEDVEGNKFLMAFWKRLGVEGHTVLVTSSSSKNGLTCIISITKNVQDLSQDGQNVAPSLF